MLTQFLILKILEVFTLILSCKIAPPLYTNETYLFHVNLMCNTYHII